MSKTFLKASLLSIIAFMCTLSFLRAQSITIAGKITDALTNEPLQGVSVVPKGGTGGTTSDQNGEYTLRVSNTNTVLVFSFVGHVDQEIALNGRSNVSVTLNPVSNSMTDVVVVGYGRQKKATLTGAVSEIKGTELIKSPTVNISNNIGGRIPGVISTNEVGEPGNDDSRLLIRGINTFSGSTSPLIVIDGVANRPGGFQRLNPNDIESITVLKDASASIYGAQAANGVILVTTKRGGIGKPKFSLGINQAMNSWVKRPEMARAHEYATLVNEQREYNGETPIYTDEEIAKFRDGTDRLLYPDTDWGSEVLKNVVGQTRVNLSLSGGSEFASYYVSYGRVYQAGQFKNSNIYSYNQDNLAINVDVKPVENIKLSFDGQLRVQKRINPPTSTNNAISGSAFGNDGAYSIFSGILGSLPIFPARFPDGRLGVSNAVNVFHNPIATTTGLGGQTKYRDLYSLNTFRARIDLPWITKGLYIDGFASADFQYNQFKDFMKTWDVYRYDRDTEEFIKDKQTTSPEGIASMKQGSTTSRTYTYNVKLNYTRVIGTDHSINAFAAYEQQQYRDEYFEAFRRNFYTDNIDELDFGSTNNATNRGNGSNFARRNYFARVNYAYAEKYMAEVQARYDGSDKFSEDRRWGLFPSVSVAWRLSRESFMAPITGENELKIRASWGLLGNDAIDPYQFLQFYNLNPRGFVFGGQAVPTVSPEVLPNPNFTWEKARSLNLAVDGGLLQNRITYTLEVFKQKRSDVLTRRISTVPAYTALILPIENIGIVENKGLEAQISYGNRSESRFQYQIGGNITYTRNKVLYVDEPLTTPDYQKQVGRAINSGNIYVATGIFQSQDDIDKYAQYQTGQIPRPGDVKFADINGDNIINGLDRTRIDLNNTPEVVYGITMNAQYMGFDASVLLAGQARSRVFFYPQASSTLNYYRFLYEGRSTPDQITDKPTTAGDFFNRPQFQANTLEFFRRNTSFMRLKNVEVGYTIPQTLSQRAKLSNARIYVNASNLLTFAKFKDVDPETLNRADGKGYPLLRTINFGVSAQF